VLVVIIIIYTFGRSIARPLFPAIISTLTEKETRVKGMGIYTLAQNLAFALGSSVGGFVSGVWGREYPFFMAAIVGLLGLGIMIFFVDEIVTHPRIETDVVEEAKAIEETDGCME